MIGFVLGAAAALGVVKVLHGGWGYCGGGRYGGRCGRGGDGRSPRRHLRFLFQRLDTSPGQEKVILEAVDAVREAAWKFRGEMREGRHRVARAMGGEHFDAASLREQFAKHDELLHALREAVVGGLAKVHEALDERQRRELAELLEEGPWGFRHHRHCGHHGYRPCGRW